MTLVGSLAAAILLLSIVTHAHPRTSSASRQHAAIPAFYRDVAPILQRHCEVCHRADGIAPMALQTYSQAKSNATAIATSAKSRSMPPWFAVAGIGHFSNDPSLSPEQIA